MKPRIIVLSKDSDECFNWLSDGWNSLTEGTHGTESANELMELATKTILEGEDIPDAVKRLEEAGFEIVRSS